MSHLVPKHDTRRRALTVAGVLLAGFFALAGIAVAAVEVELGGKVRTGDNVQIGADEVVDGNIYVFAGTASIDGSIDGDLVITGGNISIDGEIADDLTVAGGQIAVSGPIGGDLRVAGGQITVSGDVEGDLVVAGGSVEIRGDVGADLIFGAGQLTVSGDVDGSILGSAGTYSRTGSVGGTENVTLGEVEEEPSVGEQVVDESLRLLAPFVVLLLAGLLVLWLLSRPLDRVITRVRERFWWCLLFGLVLIAALVALFIAMIIVGVIISFVFGIIGLGLIVGTYWFTFVVFWIVTGYVIFLLSVYGTPLVASFASARLVFADQDGLWRSFLGFAAALLVYLLVTAIPYLGGLVSFLAFLLAGGALVLAIRNFGAPREAPASPAD